ncbi:MAG: hypothetical protein WA160_12605 [Pseudobdellovibrio sp.]
MKKVFILISFGIVNICFANVTGAEFIREMTVHRLDIKLMCSEVGKYYQKENGQSFNMKYFVALCEEHDVSKVKTDAEFIKKHNLEGISIPDELGKKHGETIRDDAKKFTIIDQHVNRVDDAVGDELAKQHGVRKGSLEYNLAKEAEHVSDLVARELREKINTSIGKPYEMGYSLKPTEDFIENNPREKEHFSQEQRDRMTKATKFIKLEKGAVINNYLKTKITPELIDKELRRITKGSAIPSIADHPSIALLHDTKSHTKVQNTCLSEALEKLERDYSLNH